MSSYTVMGQPNAKVGNNLPSRPRFSWDIRNVPWTDGQGNQEEYANSVKLWMKFHERLRNANPSKIPSDLQGIMLQAQLYGRARDIVKKISDCLLYTSPSPRDS